MAGISLHERIHGALLGAAIAAEFGYSWILDCRPFQTEHPADLLTLKLHRAKPVEPDKYRMNSANMNPFIDLGVRAYLQKHGRVTPEDFGNLLKHDAGLATPAFAWDNIHSIQEILQEGMHPRISGMGNAPNGLICAAMPAVGIYHLADPEYAYLDGVELGSVAQGKTGADWAGLCAAAVAAAFQPGATGITVVNTVIRLAMENNKEIFGQINRSARSGASFKGKPQEFVKWWAQEGGFVADRRENDFIAWNPLRWLLPLLHDYTDKPEQFMALLLGSRSSGAWNYAWVGMHTIPAIVGGTIIGALGGRDVFPTEWREWAEPLARPWQPITAVVDNRLHTESSIIHVIESLAAKTIDGQSLLYGKIRGNLLAGAIGNAMGSPVEGQFYWEIDKKHPGGIQTILEPARLESEDDNQMAALLVETYMGRDGLPVMARQFGQTWKDRLNRDHFFIQCMGHAYDLICQGWDARVTGHWIQVTGSTVMCMEPVGLYNIADPEFAAIDATAVSYMYQRGLDVMAAAMLAATVAEALRPQATVDSICQAAVRVAPTEGFKTFDKRSFESPRAYIQTCLDIAEKYDDVLAARKELYDKCLFYHQIDPLELWGLSLAMFKIAKGDVRQSAIGGTNIGRDSDTISGRAAMLSGTLRGAGGVPAEWVAMFSESSRQRIDRNAAKMTALLIEKKLPRLRRRQELAQ